ncbi:MAG: serine/threonine-protein kinase, partial [Myxococcota bacterium]|nr:serine/threonine-protein kinase [Myxococcota bacterium]
MTAQLQHPGIVPVHRMGRLEDGRPFYTMAEVRGRNLGEVIAEVHQASRQGPWRPARSGWTFRRLVDALLKACEAVAYAHSRGVVHRDLKPANIMVGDFGEVMVVDWGLAKVVGVEEPERVTTTVELDQTMHGTIMGTLSYIPPEQARGDIDQVGPASDVYSLGAILHHMLSGRKPFAGLTPSQVLAQLELRALPPPRRQPIDEEDDDGSIVLYGHDLRGFSSPLQLPDELVSTCVRATARDPADRFTDAGALAVEIASWLDGARRREQALEAVAHAESLGPEIIDLHERADERQTEAEAMLADVKGWQPEEDKSTGWGMEDTATSLRREADRLDLQVEQALYGALRIDPTLPEAHVALAERHRDGHATAEAARDTEAVTRAAHHVQAHADALPHDHEVRHDCFAYLEGDGALSLHTDPPGAEVLLHRYITRNRRLVPVLESSLGSTPLDRVSLPRGSYLCVIRSEGRPDVRYPVHIERQGHWDGRPPGALEPHPIQVPATADLGPHDCFVPAGWFWSGGDPEASFPLPRRRLWVPSLVLRRFPVTNIEYMAFLDDLVATGREEQALRHVPRERAGKVGEQGAMIYGRRDDGGFELV